MNIIHVPCSKMILHLYSNNCIIFRYKNIYTIIQQVSYMFRLFRSSWGRYSSNKKKNTTLANYDWMRNCRVEKQTSTLQLHVHVIISQCIFFFVEYLHHDDRKRPKHVAVLLYDCIYFCIEILCSCWNKHCKISWQYLLWNFRALWVCLILFLAIKILQSEMTVYWGIGTVELNIHLLKFLIP